MEMLASYEPHYRPNPENARMTMETLGRLPMKTEAEAETQSSKEDEEQKSDEVIWLKDFLAERKPLGLGYNAATNHELEKLRAQMKEIPSHEECEDPYLNDDYEPHQPATWRRKTADLTG